MPVESYPPIDRGKLRLARAKLVLAGQTVAGWAQEHGYSHALVDKVLSGSRRCVQGQSLEIAIKLGLRDDPAAVKPVSAGEGRANRNRGGVFQGDAA